jgi:hypothetical protein
MESPVVVLYTRVGCHLCDEARDMLVAILRRRAAGGLPAPALVERDIDTDDAWLRQFMATIPVVEVGARRLELATTAGKISRFLAETLGDAEASVER